MMFVEDGIEVNKEKPKLIEDYASIVRDNK